MFGVLAALFGFLIYNAPVQQPLFSMVVGPRVALGQEYVVPDTKALGVWAQMAFPADTKGTVIGFEVL